LGRGFETVYSNPALLSRSRQPEAAGGWQAARFAVSVDGPPNPTATSQEALTGITAGLLVPLPFRGLLAGRIALGWGAFTPAGLITRARVRPPERPQMPLMSDHVQSLNLALGLGADLGQGLRLGGGALALAQLVGDVVVRTNAAAEVGAAVDDQLVASYAPVAGAAYEGGQGVVGVVWRAALRADFDLKTRVLNLGELVLPELHISGVAQYDPMQV
jgi:long-chain fatty acid transport protein